MKKIIVILLLLTFSFYQAQNKQELFLSVGKPTFEDKWINKKNFSIGTHYLHKTFKSFSFEGYLEYAQSNNLPSFLDNPLSLDKFIKNQTTASIRENTLWSKINYVAFGTKVHYTFINTDNFFFSFFGGLGYQFSNSEIFTLSRFGFIQDTGEITEFDSSIRKESEKSFFTTIGLRFSYAIQKKYTLGLVANLHRPIISEAALVNAPLITTNYNLGITLGKQF
ncbi:MULTISPECIES: hypothetical protein [unclassified Polaribacter]|uniref:hypothetical protein n=1 Tax=unclassified Polaribacter TaxID=196858 RepID=UPI0011BE3D24|nr:MULTISPECIES: hypothetical protein [unclassified Polaribacter]TXD53557.1 hypothetical protein ES043_04000 [Polaribacter sp. IC063]TXD58629.1 hypothetical protein ES044_11965 [Polaribacter sp. IC066]